MIHEKDCEGRVARERQGKSRSAEAGSGVAGRAGRDTQGNGRAGREGCAKVRHERASAVRDSIGWFWSEPEGRASIG